MIRCSRALPVLLAAVVTAAVLALALAGAAVAEGGGCPSWNVPNAIAVAGGSPQTAQLGKAFATSLQVTLTNTNGCAVTSNVAGIGVDFVAPSSGPSGTFAGSGGTEAVVGVNTQGVATAPTFTANGIAGSYSVEVRSDFGTATLRLSNTARGVASTIAPTAGGGQVATVGGAFGLPLRAQVLDANGQPVQGASVSFSAATGTSGATASFPGGGQAAATTDSDGFATSPRLVANGTAGRFTISASTSDLAAVATFQLQNQAVTIAARGGGPRSATVDGRYRKPLGARVVDAAGRPIAGAGVTFMINAAAGGATATFIGGASQANAVTDDEGEATSPPLVANKTAGVFTASASTAGGKTAAGYTLRNLAGAPSSISAGVASGASTPVGSRFPIRLAVTVEDANGNLVSGVRVTFTAPAHGQGGRFVRSSGVRSRVAHVQTDADGVAVAPSLRANRRPGGYVVVAAVAGMSKRAVFALVNEPSR